jgi:TatD DNase family protein
MRLVDTHTHLDCEEFDADRQEMLSRARLAGVRRMLVMGITREHWGRLWQLVASEPGLYAALGLHPVYLDQHRPDHLAQLHALLTEHRADPRLCAIGEIGLDYFVTELDRGQQRHYLEAQLELAREFELPVLLHVRRAHADMISTLKRFRLPRAGIVHAFAGSIEEAREYIRLGFRLGLGGAPTWPQATRLHRVVAALPAEAIVLETDAPDMAPSFHAYQRNSPELLPGICEHIAAIRGESTETLARRALHNTCELFGWQPDAV